MDEELKSLLERGIQAIESLAQDEIKVETFPAVCPHCEKINPRIRVEEQASEGSMVEFVIEAHCLECNKVFIGVPFMWQNTKDIEQASHVIRERAEQYGL